MSKMELWDAVSKTDPAHTKRVNQRGGFTAIDAQYQIKRATEQFGPVGIGWGYKVERMERLDQFVVVYVTMWHGARENTFGPVLGCAEMFGNRPDSDAPKKATTDAITKGLSQLGFNADVFLGLFDDNKYVQQRMAEEQRAKAHVVPSEVMEAISGAADLGSLQKVWRANREWQTHPDFTAAKDKRKAELDRRGA
jgi:hypothetical protein